MRRQPSPAYEQAPDVEPAVRQSANCARCGSTLDFATNGHGVLLEICPHCTHGQPLRLRAARAVHRCQGCGAVMDERYAPDDAHCRRCIPRLRKWAKCMDCGENCKQTRCGRCRRTHQTAMQKKQLLARRSRLDMYFTNNDGDS